MIIMGITDLLLCSVCHMLCVLVSDILVFLISHVRRILLSECPQCREPKVFSKFEELEQHMRKQHELFCCKICARHLKVIYLWCVFFIMNFCIVVSGLWWNMCPLVATWEGCHLKLFRSHVPRYFHMRKSGTIAKTWLDIERKGTQMTHPTEVTPCVNFVTSATWTMTSSSNTCGEITISAISAMQMEPKSTTG